MRLYGWLALASIMALSACAKEADRTSAHTPLTERQRDSVIAASGLYGAAVVGRAMAASDSAAARAARLNTLSH